MMNPRYPLRVRRSRQRGVAAVELALLLPVFVVFLASSLFLARIMWHYTVAQKVAHDVAHAMAKLSRPEMSNKHMYAAAVAMAVAGGQRELAELVPGGEAATVEVTCDPGTCPPEAPRNQGFVRVRVRMRVDDPVFHASAAGVPIAIDVRTPHVGR